MVYLHPELALGDTDLEVYTLDQLEPGLSPDAIYNITNGREGQEVTKVHNSNKKLLFRSCKWVVEKQSINSDEYCDVRRYM